jgi:hypothetical protein
VCSYSVLDVISLAVAGFLVAGAQSALAQGAPKEFV